MTVIPYFLPDLEELLRMVAATMGEVGHVQEPLDAPADVDEGAVGLHAGHLAAQDAAHHHLAQGFLALLAPFLLEHCAT